MNRDEIYLRHVLENITKIENSTKGIKKTEFSKDIDVQDATIRRIEVIGEAVKNISSSLKTKHSTIEWKKIAGTRDILIHSYFSVDIDLVWEISRKDLLKLKKQVKDILDSDF